MLIWNETGWPDRTSPPASLTTVWYLKADGCDITIVMAIIKAKVKVNFFMLFYFKINNVFIKPSVFYTGS